jgi:hypothetical protein
MSGSVAVGAANAADVKSALTVAQRSRRPGKRGSNGNRPSNLANNSGVASARAAANTAALLPSKPAALAKLITQPAINIMNAADTTALLLFE